jgi:hypothetical protein
MSIDHQSEVALPTFDLDSDFPKDTVEEIPDSQVLPTMDEETDAFSVNISRWNTGVFNAGDRQDFVGIDYIHNILDQTFSTEPETASPSEQTSLFTPSTSNSPNLSMLELTPPKRKSGQSAPLGDQEKRPRHTFTCVFCKSPFHCNKKEDIK